MQTLRIIMIAAVVAVGLGVFWFSYQSGVLGPQTSQVLQGSAGPKIGGPFEMVNHWGEPTTDKDFGDTYRLMFFGFTYCPDICPVTLSVISSALDQMGTDATRVTPLFISVDPGRDTPEAMRDYVSSFHPGIIGLTGSEEQVDHVAKSYGVYYAKSAATADDPDNYLVDHTSITYLITPDNTYAAHFSHGTSAEDIAAGVLRVLNGG